MICNMISSLQLRRGVPIAGDFATERPADLGSDDRPATGLFLDHLIKV